MVFVFAHTAQAFPPPAPVITWPPSGAVVGSNRPDITWTGVAHDAYEVHIGSQNVPASADGWNSGQVASSADTATTPALVTQQNWFLFVRLHNSDGWGNWSDANHFFYIAGELLNDPYFVAGQVGSQWQHTLCYNPDRNEYLIAYFDNSKGEESVVSYYRLDGQGQRIGSEVWILDDLQGIRNPSVCYNSVHHEYLIKYAGYTPNDNRVHTQRVNAVTGALIGGSNMIRTSYILDLYATGTSVAYSSISDCFLTVWEEYDQGDLYALRLNAAGLPAGTPFRIDADQAQYCREQVISYNVANDEFMITFQGVTSVQNDWDFFGQRIRASDGAMLGSNIPISATVDIEGDGGVAYDADLNRYMVIYAGGSPSPSSQLVSATGTLIGPRFRIAPDDSYNGAMCSIAWNAVTKEYLASWAHGASAANFMRRISPNGVCIGEPVRINGDVAGFGNWWPRPVANTVNNEFLIAWFNQYDNVWVRRFKTYSSPSDPTPPASVTGLTLGRLPSSISLNWTNPSTADFMGTTIRFKTTGFPTGPTDGTFLVDSPNAPSTSDSYVHTGLVSGTTYYYAAFAHDEAFNYAAPALASAKVQTGDFDNDGDVDLVDFAHLQRCFSGDGNPYGAGCTDADLNEDGSIGSSDLSMFLPCLSGANVPPGC